MKTKLIDLQIENFKGIKKFKLTPHGDNARVVGENGSCKTTLKDTFTWVLFGKDSDNRPDSGKGAFSIHPLDENNFFIPKVVTMASAMLEFDDKPVVLRRELHEKKGGGWDTLCWINEVPKKVGEYKDAIAELIGENEFKMLTDLHFVNDKMHHTDRRTLFLSMAGTIETPAEFKKVIDAAAGREIADYKKVIADQRKRLVKERDEIGPRIDEQQKTLDAYAGQTDDEALKKQREELKEANSRLDEKRKELLRSEADRAEQIDLINRLKSKRADRESELKNDTVGHQPLIKEKEQIQKAVDKKDNAVNTTEREILSCQSSIQTQKLKYQSSVEEFQRLGDQYKNLKDQDFSKATCSTCGQILPADKVKDLQDKHEERLKALRADGLTAKANRDAESQKLDDFGKQLDKLQEKLEFAKIELAEYRTSAKEAIEKIDEQLQHRIIIKPADDAVWKQLTADIDAAADRIGPPMSEQLETIQKQQSDNNDLLLRIDQTLGASDSRAKADIRIKELQVKEKELSQQIAELDGKLNDVEDYQRWQSGEIEARVNQRFKHVKYKLFNTLLNGSIEPCCDAVLNGTPYQDCSYGEKMMIGADVINVLSEYYGMSVPVFIDNAESLTLDLGLKCQQIKLYADPNEKEIRVLTDTRKAPETPVACAPSPELDSLDEPEGEPKDDHDDVFGEETAEPADQGTPAVSGYHCNCCKKDFAEPKGGKKNLCPNCFSNKIELKS
jgi:hypothetical protein